MNGRRSGRDRRSDLEGWFLLDPPSPTPPNVAELAVRVTHGNLSQRKIAFVTGRTTVEESRVGSRFVVPVAGSMASFANDTVSLPASAPGRVSTSSPPSSPSRTVTRTAEALPPSSARSRS